MPFGITMWLAKVRLLNPVRFGMQGHVVRNLLPYRELLAQGPDLYPENPPYERLAEVWHTFAQHSIPNYAGFLKTMASEPWQIASVLDLACGAGSVTERLAGVFRQAIGLDSSQAMLTKARNRCSGIANARFVHGDFRDFHLGQKFNAIVCASDSINYVRDVDELARVFRCVADHLQPGGIFVFDSTTEKRMRASSGVDIYAELNGVCLAIKFQYDPTRRAQEAMVYLPAGWERHCRIPIDPQDVAAAAQDTGLTLSDYFSRATIPGRWYVGARCFFVLKKAA